MATLSTSEILADVISAFKTRVPALLGMSTDFRSSTQSLKLNKTYTAHVATLPSISTYDNSTGYANGAQTANSLLADVPVTVDVHKHVPIKWSHLEDIANDKGEYEKAIANAGYVLAKGVVDSVLAKVTSGNITHSVTYAAADCDVDMLTDATGTLNTQRASTRNRRVLLNTAAANALSVDSRMASKDYQGQITTTDGYRRWTNAFGFTEILEYPDLPTAGSLVGVAFEPSALVVLAGIPDDFNSFAPAGIPRVMGFETVTSEGITMAAVSWQEPGTGNLFWSPTIVYGSAVGAQGGSANTKTDRAGLRIVSA